MLVPPAWQNVETLDADLRAFYEFNSKHMEAWDGPAGLVIQDGRHAICMLDRNGLRPARWVITKNGYITLASEIGVWGYEPEDVISKGRVGPGQILVIDTVTGKLLETSDVNNHLKKMRPYRQWLRENAVRLQGSPELEEHLSDKGLTGDSSKQLKKCLWSLLKNVISYCVRLQKVVRKLSVQWGMIPQWQYCHVKCAMYLISSVSNLRR